MREIGETKAGAAGSRTVRWAAPEALALGLLALGGALGLVLWSKWGLLIALQTVVLYCF